MDLKFSKVTRKGPVTIITLSRPEVYNALHTDAHFELNKVFDDFSADPEQWIAIITGAGDKAFCAGNDLKWQAAGGKRGWDKGGFAGLTSRFDCDKPIIAAVNGVAMGGRRECHLCPARAARRPRCLGRRRAPPAAPDRAEARHGHDPHRAPRLGQGGS
jgi:enoyl-CoA hydratase/carnithine racemase